MRRFCFALAVLLAACLDVAPAELAKAGQVGGELVLTPGSRGDALALLYSRTPGEPDEAAVPRYLTAVSDARLSRGDLRYVFGQVQPNPYRLRAFLDVDRNFRPDLDVLAQPGAGDRTSEPIDLNLQPGEHLFLKVPIARPVGREPPAFRLDALGLDELVLPDQPGLVTFELVLEPLGGALARDRLAFVVSLADEDGDGRPDDANTDGLPDLYPQLFLRFLPRPGQEVPTDRAGRPATVIVPLAFNPAPFLASLAGALDAEIAVERLQFFLLPQAQAITYPLGKGRQASAMDAIPIGSYELVMLTRSGQFWRLPNDLAGEKGAAVGGPYPDQGVRFRFVHGGPLDGGF